MRDANAHINAEVCVVSGLVLDAHINAKGVVDAHVAAAYANGKVRLVGAEVGMWQDGVSLKV